MIKKISRRTFLKSAAASAAALGLAGIAPGAAGAEEAEEYCMPGQKERTLWDNPRTTNDGKPFVIRPGERVTIADI